jgi:hypothetical protein
MNSFLLRHVKLNHPQVASMLQYQCRADASTASSSSSSSSVVQKTPIVLDNHKPPPPLDADRMRMHPRIGNREIVGYGLKGKPEYFDTVMFPCPSIRWEADTPEIAELRKKEKGDWKQLSKEDKKRRKLCFIFDLIVFIRIFILVYRSSFRQTFEEFTAPTGIWKWAVGWTLISLAGLTLAYDGWRRICMCLYNTNKLFCKHLYHF